jgi:hypothetical protein
MQNDTSLYRIIQRHNASGSNKLETDESRY